MTFYRKMLNYVDSFSFLKEEDQANIIAKLYEPRFETLTNITSFIPLIGPLVERTVQTSHQTRRTMTACFRNLLKDFRLSLLYATLFRLIMHETRKELGIFLQRPISN